MFDDLTDEERRQLSSVLYALALSGLPTLRGIGGSGYAPNRTMVDGREAKVPLVEWRVDVAVSAEELGVVEPERPAWKLWVWPGGERAKL